MPDYPHPRIRMPDPSSFDAMRLYWELTPPLTPPTLDESESSAERRRAERERQRQLRWCNNCGIAIELDMDEHHFCEDCDVYRCDSCGPCGEENNYRRGGVHDYNWRPRHFKPKGNYPAEALLGVELEVGGRREEHIIDAVHTIDSVEDHLYLKHDGSISGLEIVAHPMTLTWAREYPFDALLAELRRIRCRVDDGYGLHVHVSRNAFQYKPGKQSMTHQMMWLLFLSRNFRNLERLARRPSNRYCQFSKPLPGELKRKAQGRASYDDSRYVAVNCLNDRTFELRFFKATLNYQEFFAALEFADASVCYTREVNSSNVLRGNGLTWDHFATWVAEHDYTNLTAEIERRKDTAEIERRKDTAPVEPVAETPRTRRRRVQYFAAQIARAEDLEVGDVFSVADEAHTFPLYLESIPGVQYTVTEIDILDNEILVGFMSRLRGRREQKFFPLNHPVTIHRTD